MYQKKTLVNQILSIQVFDKNWGEAKKIYRNL